MPAKKMERPARERLLEAANELFYAEGVHTVGIDRVIERAGVAKASLYGTFGSKDELVCAYLSARAEARHARIEKRVAQHDDPRDKILSVFDLLCERVREPEFRGCPFVNATAEGPRDEGKAHQIVLATRAWVRDLFTTLAADLGADDPARTARCLQILYDGAMTGASMEGDPGDADEARAMAESLLDAHAPARRRGRKPVKGRA